MVIAIPAMLSILHPSRNPEAGMLACYRLYGTLGGLFPSTLLDLGFVHEREVCALQAVESLIS